MKDKQNTGGNNGEKGEVKASTGLKAERTSEVIDEKAEINKLLDEGYTVKQIIDLGFKRRTAYYYAKQRTKPENNPAPSNSQTPDDGAISPEQVSKGKHEIIKLGSKDVIPPEAILDVLHLPQDGDSVEVWRRGVLDGVGLLLLGARYGQLTAAGQAEIIKSQLDVMREAKESGIEMAQRAAAEAAARAAMHIDQKVDELVKEKPDIAHAPRPMEGMMARTFETMMNRMTDKIFPTASGETAPPGATVRHEKKEVGGVKETAPPPGATVRYESKE